MSSAWTGGLFYFQGGLAVRLTKFWILRRSVPEAEIQTWADISQIDIRPATRNSQAIAIS